MKEIYYSGEIGKGLKFQVSNSSFKEVSKYTWWLGRNGYATTQLKFPEKGRWIPVTLHRLLKGFPKGVEIDHRDGNKHNYQLSNLRIATHQQNARNRPRQNNNMSSKYKGVTWHKDRNKWVARLQVLNKNLYCGIFSSEEDAARAYDKKAKQIFGKFVKLNFND